MFDFILFCYRDFTFICRFPLSPGPLDLGLGPKSIWVQIESHLGPILAISSAHHCGPFKQQGKPKNRPRFGPEKQIPQQ